MKWPKSTAERNEGEGAPISACRPAGRAALGPGRWAGGEGVALRAAERGGASRSR